MGLWKNTVRLKAIFSTFAGVLADPSNVTLTINDYTTGGSYVNASGSYIIRESLGTYYYDYTIQPPRNGKLLYEWSGVLEGSDIVNRGTIDKEFLKT